MNSQNQKCVVPNYAGPWQTMSPKLNNDLVKCVLKLGFEQMTPVQSATISNMLDNKDVVVEAVTGSGKTFAFLLPIAQILTSDQDFSGLGAVVIAPTKELASQIFKVYQSLEIHGLKALAVIGGEGSVDDSINTILKQKINILFGTPRRMVDILNSPKISKRNVKVLCLDEADRL